MTRAKMERARKMILVPEGPTTPAAPVPAVEALAAAEEKSLQTPGDNFSRLDTEMYDVLRAKGARDDYEKCLNYLQILRRYLFSATVNVSPNAKRITRLTKSKPFARK